MPSTYPDHVNDAQTWTTIGGFLTVVVAMSAMLLRVVHTEVSSIRTEVASVRSEVELSRSMTMTEISGLRAETLVRFDGVDRRFDAVDRRIDGLDTDVQVLTRRVFGIDEGQ